MHTRFLIALSLATLAACAADPPSSPPPPAPTARALVDLPPDAVVDAAIDAAPDGSLAQDDRPFLQGLIDGTPDGGTLVIPPGNYVVRRWTTSDYALRVARPMTIRGAGVVIAQAPATPASVRLVHIDAPDVALEDLTLDGAAEMQLDEDGHRAGPFVTRERFRASRIVVRNFTGDGIYLYSNPTTGQSASDAVIEDVTLTDNHRNGLTMGGWNLARISVRGGTFARNHAQQIDSETGAGSTVNDVTIVDAYIDPGPSTDYAITVSGTGTATRSARWRVTGNTITSGGIFIVWAEDILIAGNTITSSSAKPCVYIYRTNNHTTVAHNRCTMTDAAASFPSGIAAIGTGGTSAASDLSIVDNDVAIASPTGLGIRVQGAKSATLVGNVLRGSGVVNLGGSAIQIRPTDPNIPMDLAVVVGNTGAGFGKRGLAIAGNVTARLSQLTAVGNTFGDATAVQDVGMYLDDGTHPLVRSTLVDNHYGAGVTSGRFGEALP